MSQKQGFKIVDLWDYMQYPKRVKELRHAETYYNQSWKEFNFSGPGYPLR